jgi:hypothetical protein
MLDASPKMSQITMLLLLAGILQTISVWPSSLTVAFGVTNFGVKMAKNGNFETYKF